MPTRKTLAATALGAVLTAGLLAPAVQAQEKTDFKIAWTIYAGWMPWGYIQDSGIMDKWAAKYDLDIEVVQLNDYIESINQYTAGAFDGVTATTMDALSIPAGGGVDSTALIIGDYSDGNDAIIAKSDIGLGDLAGMPVNLVELSVSHYLLARALESAELSERDLGGVINTSDADMIAAYQTQDVEVVVTWNPLVEAIMEGGDAHKIYDSSDIPGEIIDALFVSTEVLEANPDFGKALTGAWYETMALMDSGTPEGDEALSAMAEAAGTDLAGYKRQLAATAMFYTPGAAKDFTEGAALPDTMVSVAEFLFDKGILGEGAPGADFVGVAYPDGSTTGDAGNVNMRFDTTYVTMAAEGAL
ncbi:putative urea ABC transporter substrate-binding protein [Pseudooceanicola algae]|uniref:Uncharacterized protein n=1 Tax=Pseudooceanicola algae TaxID=1537215 RepID=A0A418SGW8_9RHOB|nr:putative urea ABC transporter substrate-binding protein [Pseudooceanicola algae]QPM88826.1 hypothetical protein PSAL_000280 [Pseudooceanicola algae]